ncbi:MAG: hypothetical protein AB1781_04540 [Pseudomonadota bacterium]
MAFAKRYVVAFAAAILLGGCSSFGEELWPSLTGDEPAEGGTLIGKTGEPSTERIVIEPSEAEQAAGTPGTGDGAYAAAPQMGPPILGTSSFEPTAVTPGQSTGTYVGQKVTQIRSELSTLRANLSQRNGGLQQIRSTTVNNAQQYHGAIAAIQARLQVGTTPGNPILVSQWQTGQQLLGNISTDVSNMNVLANNVAGDSAMAAYILESTRAAYSLSGAIDEDHRQLAILEDEVNRTVVMVDRLLNELSEDINRQTAYLNNERRNLTMLSVAIKNGELYGPSLANRAFSAPPIRAQLSSGGIETAELATPSPEAGRRPLVVIRFDRENVEYEQALYTAIRDALDRRPNATFDLVAIASMKGNTADAARNTNTSKKNAEDVLRALRDMGLPADRLNLKAMQSMDAESNEVHIYVR